MGHLRTNPSQAHYKKLVSEGLLDGGCALCAGEALREYTHWKIMQNAFPWDRIAARHEMILPKRHVQEHELSSAEIAEFQHIKHEYLHKEYEFITEATYRTKSIPAHHHVHLLEVTDEQ